MLFTFIIVLCVSSIITDWVEAAWSNIQQHQDILFAFLLYYKIFFSSNHFIATRNSASDINFLLARNSVGMNLAKKGKAGQVTEKTNAPRQHQTLGTNQLRESTPIIGWGSSLDKVWSEISWPIHLDSSVPKWSNPFNIDLIWPEQRSKTDHIIEDQGSGSRSTNIDQGWSKLATADMQKACKPPSSLSDWSNAMDSYCQMINCDISPSVSCYAFPFNLNSN